MSISSTFYVRIYHTNVVSAAFSSYVLALSKKFVRKTRAYDVDEIDCRKKAKLALKHSIKTRKPIFFVKKRLNQLTIFMA